MGQMNDRTSREWPAGPGALEKGGQRAMYWVSMIRRPSILLLVRINPQTLTARFDTERGAAVSTHGRCPRHDDDSSGISRSKAYIFTKAEVTPKSTSSGSCGIARLSAEPVSVVTEELQTPGPIVSRSQCGVVSMAGSCCAILRPRSAAGAHGMR